MMAEAISSVEKFRRSFYDDLKKEGNREVNVKSEETINLYLRKKSADDPWLNCFYFSDKESKRSVEYLTVLATSKNLTNDKIVDLITNCDGITDEELNRCKAAMRREVRSRNLPDLSSEPERLKNLFFEERQKFREYISQQKTLSEQINRDMEIFRNSLNDCLETLEPHCKIATTSDTTIDAVRTNITKMRCMLQDFKTHANLVIENIFESMEKFERYESFDEKMDRDLFALISHIFPNFLVPRAVRIRYVRD